MRDKYVEPMSKFIAQFMKVAADVPIPRTVGNVSGCKKLSALGKGVTFQAEQLGLLPGDIPEPSCV